MLKSLLAVAATAAFATTAVAATPAPAKTSRKPAASAMTVSHTTKTGKTIHYDCAKAGNKTKSACKGK